MTLAETAMTLSYLALGDSYTIGEGVAEAERWPMQLAAALLAEGFELEPRIIARTGWTTDELAHAMDEARLTDGQYDLVTLLIGVNDQYRQRPLAEFATGFDALLHRAIGLAKHGTQGVMVLGIPDWGMTPYAQREGRDAAQVAHQIDAYNAHIHTVCQAQQVALVDVTAISRTCGAGENALVADGLHPSAAQYRQWTVQALPIAQQLLKLA
ncbi:lysophospholipase [Lysobacteraceae bacterium NML75-0749]|nr:lysophospholipase [Xanthomonadaceae bacterium NML75-0749]PJK04872.1 lysophospholipase [Xanthomonadaceae bacterium NML91-0268]